MIDSKFVQRLNERYRVLLEAPEGAWLISYESPSAPFFVAALPDRCEAPDEFCFSKIDLLTYDGAKLRILELKEPDSKETMLRCVLEGYTYLKTVDKDKLISDFSRDTGVIIPEGTQLEACPFVFRGGSQWKEMQQDRPYLKRLMEALNSKPYYAKEANGAYVVTED